MKSGSQNNVMTTVEIAQFLRVHPTTIYRLIRKRQLPVFRVGSEWRCMRERLEQWTQTTACAPFNTDPPARRGRARQGPF